MQTRVTKNKVPHRYQPSVESIEDPYFHYPDKDCVMVDFGFRRCPHLKTDPQHRVCKKCYSVPTSKCLLHNVMTCRCGYEWKHHPMRRATDVPAFDSEEVPSRE